jgi:hypothetical protein
MTAVIWDISNMERRLPDGTVPPEGEIYTIHWTANLEDQGQFANCYGSVGLGAPEEDNYTPFDEVTKEQAIEWLKAALGEEQVEAIEASLVQQIEDKLFPEQAMGLPW